MSTEIKFKILIAFSLFCLIGLAAQTYYLFDPNQRVSPSNVADSSIPDSIQQRLEEEMAKPDRIFGQDNYNLFGPGINSDPFAHMQKMRQQMGQLFNSWGVDPFTSGQSIFSQGSGAVVFPSQPEIEVSEEQDAFVVTLPKQPGQDIEIVTEVEDNKLSLAGTLRTENRQSSGGSVFSSSSTSQFSRSIPFSKEVNALGMYTTHENDRIVITLPKMES